MDYQDFQNELHATTPRKEWPEPLKVLWYDAKGNWETAHDIAQDMHNLMGSWLHGYLHRKEGDDWNAGYWYRQADRPFPKISLAEEHREMVEFILSQ